MNDTLRLDAVADALAEAVAEGQAQPLAEPVADTSADAIAPTVEGLPADAPPQASEVMARPAIASAAHYTTDIATGVLGETAADAMPAAAWCVAASGSSEHGSIDNDAPDNDASNRGRAPAEAEVTPHDDLSGTPLPFDRPIILVGMPGAGKTTIGRQLARALGREFVDLDLALEARCGVRVAVIFEIEGEAGFRRRETALLDHYSRQPGIVLATGGGAVIAPENRRCIKERGVVVYLRASTSELYDRVARDKNRPLLQTDDPMARLREILQQREPYYLEVAGVTVDTGTVPVPQLVRNLVALLQHYETTP